MTTKSFFFYGYIDGEEDQGDYWKALHEHFERLATQDDPKLARQADGSTEEVVSTGKAAKRK